MHVIVIGAGIVGVTIGHALIDEGHEVTLVDPRLEGRACEGNAGWIAHTDILPLASPDVWWRLPRWLADPHGPLTIRPDYLMRLAPWLMHFAAASRAGRIEASIAAIRALNAGAVPAWRRRLDALGLSGHLRESGVLSVWSDRAAFAAAEATIARQRAFGIPVDVLRAEALHELEPALASRAAIAAHYPTGCHVDDPGALTEALVGRALERGARLITSAAESVDVTGKHVVVRTQAAQRIWAEHAVIAAGAWSRALIERLGERIPLDTERGYNATFPPGTFGLSRPVLFEGEGFVTTPLASGDRVGGAVEFAGLQAPPDHGRTEAILAKLRSFLPDLPPSLPEPRRWMGFRPSIPDSLPVLGHASFSRRLTYAFGHGHYGLTQAAVTAEAMAALIARRPPPLDLKPFSPARFGRRKDDSVPARAAPAPASVEATSG